jgi:hypothetical protein
MPDTILFAVPWKTADVPAQTRPMTQQEYVMENIRALKSGEAPQSQVTVAAAVPGKDKKWPVNQHRFEGRNRVWYDSRGLGHLLMDNQIYATAIRNAEAVWWDFAKHPMFVGDGTEDANQTNIKIKPGAKVPRGLSAFVMPTPPGQFGFVSDREQRLASARSGAGSSQYSAQVSESRKLEKTATEIQSQNAQQSLLSSASVDRINSPEARLLQMIWDNNRELRPKLPMIEGDKFSGNMEPSDYDYDFIMVPAASAKSTTRPMLPICGEESKVEHTL